MKQHLLLHKRGNTHSHTHRAVSGRSTCVTQQQAGEPSSSLPPSLVSLEAERNQSDVRGASASLAAGLGRALEGMLGPTRRLSGTSDRTTVF